MLRLGWARALVAVQLPAATAAAAAACTAGRRLLATLPTSGEQPRDQAGSMAHGEGMSVQAPLPQQQLADPAAEEPAGWRYLAEKAQDLLRPASARGHAYHFAEDSARAVLREQLACPRGPTVESMYQPDELADTSDTITTPRSWHFSSRSDHLDQRRQEELASKCPDAK